MADDKDKTKKDKRAKKSAWIDQLANEINDDAGDEAIDRCICRLKRIKANKEK